MNLSKNKKAKSLLILNNGSIYMSSTIALKKLKKTTKTFDVFNKQILGNFKYKNIKELQHKNILTFRSKYK